MGINLSQTNDKFRQCIAREQRRELGKPAQTNADAMEKADREAEKELHKRFAAWCGLNNVACAHARMDKKSTLPEGWPDMSLGYNGRGCYIELKGPNGKTTPEQTTCILNLSLYSRMPVLVTSDLAEAIAFAKEHLKLL